MVTLVFSGLGPALVAELQDELNAAKVPPFGNVTHVEVISHPEGIVFRLEEGKGGYSFCRNCGGLNEVEVFRHFLQDPVQGLYMPITYEVKERDESVVHGIVEKYAKYGASHAAKIDWIWYERKGKCLLVMRVPKEIVCGLMHRYGGVLTTQVRGPVTVLRELPVLGKIVPQDAQEGEVMHRAFVTPYNGSEGGAEYEQCMAIHQAAVREVVAAEPCGISIGPVATWSP